MQTKKYKIKHNQKINNEALHEIYNCDDEKPILIGIAKR